MMSAATNVHMDLHSVWGIYCCDKLCCVNRSHVSILLSGDHADFDMITVPGMPQPLVSGPGRAEMYFLTPGISWIRCIHASNCGYGSSALG